MTVKLTVNLSEEVVSAAQEMATDGHWSVTEILRQAVGHHRYLTAVQRIGGQVIEQDAAGNRHEVTFP